jgi:RNA polymerase sigma factor (sigma-70 family)
MEHVDIILKHLAMANKLAAKYSRTTPSERDEILSAAYSGLWKASCKPHPKNSYVAACIKSSIIDSLRRVLPNSLSDRLLLADYYRHDGNLEERAAAMGLTPEELFRRLNKVVVVVQLINSQDIPARPVSQLGELLEVCLKLLPKRLQTAFLLKFRDQYTPPEIAQILGICRMTALTHTQTAVDILRLNRKKLADLLY